MIRYVLTPLLHQLARSPELLVLFAIAWVVALGAAAIGAGLTGAMLLAALARFNRADQEQCKHEQ